MKERSLIVLFIVLLPSYLFSQEPDFELGHLYPARKAKGFESARVDANVKLYSDGQNLSVVVEVWDELVSRNEAAHLSDHVILWFALPRSAYPRDFEYNFHPNYILSRPMATRGVQRKKVPPRLFSVYSEYARELVVDEFLNKYDYPHATRFKSDALNVPPTYQLRKEQIPFGMVKFGLFPDNRPAKLYHREKYYLLEETMGMRLGDFAKSLRYTVDFMDDGKGYVINAEISPEALGFVTLPDLEELNFMIEVVDLQANWPGVRPVLRSIRDAPSNLASLSRVRLEKPIRTNFTNIPDRIFYATGMRPLSVLTQNSWMPVKADTDAIAFREQVMSRYLVEVQFRPMPITFTSYFRQDIPMEKLSLHEDFVNMVDMQRTFVWVEGQLVESTTSLHNRLAGKTGLQSEYFRFPDGGSGLIIKNNNTVDRYGWGTCGDCLEETITFYRFEKGYSEKILTIRQGSGDNYCQIGMNNFDDYYVSKMDWIDKGRMLVLLLDHWEDEEDRKRLIVQWDDRGRNVRITSDR